MAGDRSRRESRPVATDEICCRSGSSCRAADRRHHRRQCGVEPRLSLIYTETVEKRSYGLADFVGLVSANAARSWASTGKGRSRSLRRRHRFARPRQRKIVRAAELHEADYTPWKAATRHVASLVMLRGKIVVENGTFFGRPQRRPIPAGQVPEEIRTRPAV